VALFERRETPGTYADPREYRPFLRRDFRRMCAYCERTEAYLGGEEHFEVDHFKPTKIANELKCYYPNLYYACRKCNQCKSSKWPSDEQVNIGKVFADPCAEDPYLAHLLERWDGSLTELTACGEYTNGHIRLDRPDVCEWRRLRQKAREQLSEWRQLEESLLRALGFPMFNRAEIEQGIELVRGRIVEMQDRFQISELSQP